MQDELLTPKQVSDILQIHVGTLENWRYKQIGPKWIKLGDSVRAPIRYRRSEIDRYLAESESVK